ncbi:MAG TPA: 7-cyano-7-deazaguanine synthase QueC [Rhizomicrobium sp.]|jgi:7-cyano-7-deazaguanine synthase|nr:7-cyano-7-deazaguanine synthase QueC [Rhizomicrobium sp.]
MTGLGDAALVLFSGGQDSTTCLAWALGRFPRVETVGFDYGQRHAVELSARPAILTRIRSEFPDWAPALGADHVLPLGLLSAIGGSALIAGGDQDENPPKLHGLPATFVPGRNILFLAAAAALAWRRGIRHLVGGMCETDYSGYPDCRRDTIDAMARALGLGMNAQFEIHTPLMWIDKADTWALAEALGGKKFVQLIVDETVTCYAGDRSLRHDWGYGCNACAACELRARGYERYIAQ